MISQKTYTESNAAPKGVALLFSYGYKFIFLLLFVSFTACENDMKRVHELTSLSSLPELEINGMVMEYSESGRVNVKVEAVLAEIYPGKGEYYNFPKGVVLSTYGIDEEGASVETSVMKADSAIYFKGNHLEAYGNIELIGKDGIKLNTNFITWDEKKRWISTTDTVYIYENGFKKTSMGIEAKDDFSYYKFIKLTGKIPIDAKKTDE